MGTHWKNVILWVKIFVSEKYQSYWNWLKSNENIQFETDKIRFCKCGRGSKIVVTSLFGEHILSLIMNIEPKINITNKKVI